MAQLEACRHWGGSLIFGFAGIVVLGGAASAQGAEPSDAQRQEAQARQDLHHEAPDDAPGVPAKPDPKAARAQPRASTEGTTSFTTFQVNVDSQGANIPGDAANEPSIAVDPTNRQRKAIGWRQFDTIASNFRQAGNGHTSDGGRSWTFPGVIDPGVFRSDPVLASDAQGTFFYNSLQSDFSIQIFKSLDGGATWGVPVQAFGGDKQWMAIDRTGGIGQGNIYQSWSVFAGCCSNNIFTRSTNGGASFSTPITLPDTPIFGTLDVAPNGDLFIAGTDPNDFTNFFVVKSTNADIPLGTPTFSSTNIDLDGGLGIFVGGPNPQGLLGQVNVRVDPTNSHVYVLCSIDPPGPDPLDVHFIRSEDCGATWTLPIRVNDDAAGTNAWQWMAAMTVAPNGRIDAVWLDTRNSGLDNVSQLFHSSSSDGGNNWSTNQVASASFDSHVGWPQQNKMGDYFDMESDVVGADLAWANTLNGEQDVYYTRIGDFDCNQNGIGDSIDISMATSTDVNTNGIPDDCECERNVYCTAGTTSGGCRPAISSAGLPSASASSGFDIIVSNLEGKKNGVVFYGISGRNAAPWGAGSSFLCTKAPSQRMGTVNSGGTSGNCDGVFSVDWTAFVTTRPNALGNPFAFGDSVWAQGWFRDPGSAKNTSLSDALEFTVCP